MPAIYAILSQFSAANTCTKEVNIVFLKTTALREKCLYSELCWSTSSRIRTEYNAPYLSVFSLNAGEYGPEWHVITYTFHAVLVCLGNSHCMLIQKQFPEAFCNKGALRNFAKFTEKHLRQILFLNKIAALAWSCNFIKKRLWRRCFTKNFAKFLRAPFLTKHRRWLLCL